MQLLARAASRAACPPASRSWTARVTASGARAGSTDEEFERDVARRMVDPAGDAALVADWLAVAAAARAQHAARSAARSATSGSRWARCSGCRSSPTCPTCAPRCSRSAVCSHGDALGRARRAAAERACARRRAAAWGEREVLMLNMTRDEHFPIEGAIEVLEAIPGPKRMGVWAGTHVEIPPEAIAAGQSIPGAHARLSPDASLGAVSGEPYDPPRVAPRRSLLPTGAPPRRRCAARSRAPRQESPLAPVTVVVPGNSVGVAVAAPARVGRARPGLDRGLRADRRQLPHRVPPGRAARRAAARGRRPAARVHAGGRGGGPPRARRRIRARCSGRVATHPATEEALVRRAPRALRSRRAPRSTCSPARARGRARSCGSTGS